MWFLSFFITTIVINLFCVSAVAPTSTTVMNYRNATCNIFDDNFSVPKWGTGKCYGTDGNYVSRVGNTHTYYFNDTNAEEMIAWHRNRSLHQRPFGYSPGGIQFIGWDNLFSIGTICQTIVLYVIISILWLWVEFFLGYKRHPTNGPVAIA